jgi:hypothetical protein
VRLGRSNSGEKTPSCADCGTANCHLVTVRFAPFGSEDYYYKWLCGSCEFLREHPDAEKLTHPSGLPVNWPRRGQPKQKETLF